MGKDASILVITPEYRPPRCIALLDLCTGVEAQTHARRHSRQKNSVSMHTGLQAFRYAWRKWEGRRIKCTDAAQSVRTTYDGAATQTRLPHGRERRLKVSVKSRAGKLVFPVAVWRTLGREHWAVRRVTLVWLNRAVRDTSFICQRSPKKTLLKTPKEKKKLRS